MRQVTVNITWPDGSVAEAKANFEAPGFSVPVAWQGDSHRVASLPPRIAPRAGGELCTLAVLLSSSREVAEAEGAKIAWEAHGDYDFWA